MQLVLLVASSMSYPSFLKINCNETKHLLPSWLIVTYWPCQSAPIPYHDNTDLFKKWFTHKKFEAEVLQLMHPHFEKVWYILDFFFFRVWWPVS